MLVDRTEVHPPEIAGRERTHGEEMDLQNLVVEVGKLGRMNDNPGNQQEQQAGGNERRKNMTAGRRSKRIAFTAVCLSNVFL